MPRDLSHFDSLAELVELERRAERARFAEEKGRLPLAELEARGVVFLDLESVEESVGLGGRILVTLERADRAPLSAPLREGDEVEVRPRKSEEVEPVRAIISRGGHRRVQLAFERAPPQFVSEGRLRLDRSANEVTFDRAQLALRRIRAMERGIERRRRDVLLAAAPPAFERAKLEASRPLNPEQLEAVQKALGARDFFLVHGPPGTGKSTVLAEIAVQAVRAGQRVVCAAASNAAVDHLLELCLLSGLSAVRVGHPARVMERLQAHTLDLMVEDHPDRALALELFEEAFELFGYARKQRKQGRSRERFSRARSSTAEARQLMEEARALEKKAVRTVLDRAQVVLATLSSIDAGPLAGESYDLALVDEATQAIEPLSLWAFLKAPRVVLAGDHRQLPPTVLSEQALARGLGVSLFERLLSDHGEGVKRTLLEQHRMHESIMAFPSREMYGGELRAHPAVARRTLTEVLAPGASVDAPPVLFLDTAGKGFEEARPEGDVSYRNEGEAELVAVRARELLAAGLPARELAIISPYSAQVRHLRELIAAPEVEIDTVDAFQGREKDAVLVSLTRSNSEGALGFLTDLRRMNVAITRARRHLFVVGDSATVGAHPYFTRFIESAQAQGGYRSAWEWEINS